MKLYKRWLIASLAATLTPTMTLANDSGRSEQQESHHASEQHQDDSGSEKPGNDKSDNRADKSGAQYQATPVGWIRMAVDYNNDGYFDAVETIYTYDFEKARDSSRARANRDARRMSEKGSAQSSAHQSHRSGQGSNSQKSHSDQKETVQGELLQIRKDSFAGMDGQYVLAKVRKENNMPAKVLLGKDSELKSLGLQEGDQVTVTGERGRINDRPMLLASKIKSGDKEISLEMASSRFARRVRGEILDTRSTTFRGHDGEFVIATVRLNSGKEATVNMGQKSKLDKLDLGQGDDVKLIVRPTKINDEKAMVADEVHANGKAVNVSPPKKRTSQKSNKKDKAKSEAGDKSTSSRGQAALGLALGDSQQGVVALAVHPQSPLADVDFQVGDRILSINGKAMESAQDVVELVEGMRPNAKLKIKTRRDDEEKTVEVKLTTRKKLASQS